MECTIEINVPFLGFHLSETFNTDEKTPQEVIINQFQKWQLGRANIKVSLNPPTKSPVHFEHNFSQLDFYSSLSRYASHFDRFFIDNLAGKDTGNAGMQPGTATS